MVDLEELLKYVIEHGASDLHVKVGSRPFVRIDGHLDETAFDQVTPSDTERIAEAIIPERRKQEFDETSEADFAYGVSGMGRFRVNVFRQRGSVGLVLRRVLAGIPTLEELGLPPIARRLAEENRGLVLVTGPTGSGKTTTVASMIDHINNTQCRHIVTIEDPIEVLHRDRCSLINQREIGSDTADYHAALKRVLRQDPDVIFIGEMRDAETVWAAIAAAETGHLVFATLHTTNASETINRVIDFFPPHQHRQIRMSVAASIRGILSQRLLERADNNGRVVACEVLIGTGRVFDRIANDAVHELEEVIADGEYYGMQTFDQHLFNLYKNGLIDLRSAFATASHPHDLRVAMQQAGLSTGGIDPELKGDAVGKVARPVRAPIEP